MWYERMIRSLLDSRTDVLFVFDPMNLIEYSKIEEIIGGEYPTIMKYTNELELRRILRKNTQKILVIFEDKNYIPFDLLSTYAVIDIDISDIFPLLNEEALLNIPYDDYQLIYESYTEIKSEKFEKLSKEDTKKFLNCVLLSNKTKYRKKVLELRSSLNELIRTPITDCRRWTSIAGEISKIFGELMFTVHCKNIEINTEELENTKKEINKQFKEQIKKYYEDLIYYPNPLINSNILHIIFQDKNSRNALICFDCMGFEEWNAIKGYLDERTHLKFNMKYSFSMLPSETNYSSSALFAGLLPKEIKELEFINSMNWKNEERLFKYAISEKMGIDDCQIYFQRCGTPKEVKISYDCFSDYRAIGMVFSFIDRFTHRNLVNKKILLNDIQTHLEDSDLDSLIMALLDQEFRVWFVSDHGSIFSKGNGINVSKDLVDLKAKRCLIGSRIGLLKEYKTDDSFLIQFKNIIGDEYMLLLTGNYMFAGKNEKGLTHGGISLEEVVVPFIEVKYDERV